MMTQSEFKSKGHLSTFGENMQLEQPTSSVPPKHLPEQDGVLARRIQKR